MTNSHSLPPFDALAVVPSGPKLMSRTWLIFRQLLLNIPVPWIRGLGRWPQGCRCRRGSPLVRCAGIVQRWSGQRSWGAILIACGITTRPGEAHGRDASHQQDCQTESAQRFHDDVLPAEVLQRERPCRYRDPRRQAGRVGLAGPPSTAAERIALARPLRQGLARIGTQPGAGTLVRPRHPRAADLEAPAQAKPQRSPPREGFLGPSPSRSIPTLGSSPWHGT